MNTPAAQIIDALGGTAKVARLFQLRMPSVSKWRQSGIPRARMMYLQVAHPEVLLDVDVEAATAVDWAGVASAGGAQQRVVA